MKLSMNMPGYIQDAHKDYVELLSRKDIVEIYIMAPYFSDDKIAGSLIKAADRLKDKVAKEKKDQVKSKSVSIRKKLLSKLVKKELEKEKRIHVVFPKKRENRIIEVSRYYAYYLRNNPIVETLQFNAKTDSENFEMLHAKQMAVILRNRKKKWTKYVKFGGSYNPAGRAQNMWEVNAMQFNGHWNKTDKGPNASSDENPIKNYLDNIMKAVGTEYSEPFPWGSIIVKISWWERISMRFAQLLWF